VDMEVGLWGPGDEYSMVVGGVGTLLRRFLMTSHTLMAATRAMMATPPSTPPTMAPIGGELAGVGGGVVVVEIVVLEVVLEVMGVLVLEVEDVGVAYKVM